MKKRKTVKLLVTVSYPDKQDLRNYAEVGSQYDSDLKIRKFETFKKVGA